MKCFCAIVAGLLVLVSNQCHVEHRMKFKKIEYLYSEMEAAPETLSIEGSGRSRYESHTNAATPDYPEIGNFETVLSESAIEGLSAMLDNPPFKELPDHWGRVRPSDLYHRIRVITDRETIEKLVTTREPVDSRLQEVITRLDQIVAQVIQHPAQTLRCELSSIEAGSGGVVTATMSLSNRGNQITNCRNPAGMVQAPDAHLSLQVWPDKPPSELRAGDDVSAEVYKIEPLGQPRTGASNPSILELVPRGSASFRIYASPRLKNGGAYLCRVSYSNSAGALSGNPLIVGELFSRPVRFEAH